MNVANISYARNHLSELLSRVREGETIIIMDRHTQVARLEPPTSSGKSGSVWKADLVRRGIVRPAQHPLNPEVLSALPLPTPRDGGDILAALHSDREESR